MNLCRLKGGTTSQLRVASRAILLRHFSSGRSLALARAVQQEIAHPNAFSIPHCDFEPSPYDGPSYEEVLRIRKSKLTPALLTFYKDPLLIHQGHMQYLFDHTGKRYLDMFAGIVTVSVGHCHPYVNEKLKQQLDKLW